MKKVYAFLADGLEEVEALMVIDLLRRTKKLDVVMVSIKDDLMVEGSHGIKIMADTTIDETEHTGSGLGWGLVSGFQFLCKSLAPFAVVLHEQGPDAQALRHFDVARAIVEEAQLFGLDLFLRKDEAEEIRIGLHHLANIAEIARIEIIIQRMAVPVERGRPRPFHDIGIGIGKQHDAVPGLTEGENGVEVALRNTVDKAHAGVAALIPAHFPSGLPAHLFAEFLRIDPATFQVTEKTALLEGVEEVAYVRDAQFLKVPDGLFKTDGDNHAAKIQCDGLDHVSFQKSAAKLQKNPKIFA